MVIDAEFGRNDHDSIFYNCDWKSVETTWYQNWPTNYIKLVVKINKIYIVWCSGYLLRWISHGEANKFYKNRSNIKEK
jgi:hypothetical protein